MAKLSAHGYEVARVVTSQVHPDRTYDIDTESWVETTARYEYHYSFRSDGHILRRMVGLDTHRNYPEGSRYRKQDFGWKLYKRLAEPSRETVRRQKGQAHKLSRMAESEGRLIDVKVSGGVYA